MSTQTGTTISHPNMAYGQWSSESTPEDHVVTCGFDPMLVIVGIDADSAAPELYFGCNIGSFANGIHVLSHDTAQLNQTAVASGVNFSGRTFTVDAAVQDASGENWWIAYGQ